MRFFIRLLFTASIIGLIAAVIYQNNPALKRQVKRHLTHSFENAWDADLKVGECSLDIIHANVTLSDVIVRSRKAPGNAVKVGTLEAKLHRLAYLFDKKIIVDVTLKNIALLTDSAAVDEQLASLFPSKEASSDKNFAINSFTLENISFRQRHESHVLDARIIGKIALHKKAPGWNINMSIKQAKAEYDGKPLIEEFSGSYHLTTGPEYTAQGKNTVSTTLFNHQSGISDVEWKKGHEKVAFRTLDHSVNLLLKKNPEGFVCSGKAPTALLLALAKAAGKKNIVEKVQPLLEKNAAQGTSSFWSVWNPEEEKGSIYLYSKKSTVGPLFDGAGACKVDINKERVTVSGRIGAHDVGLFTLNGTYSLKEDRGTFVAQNSTDITIPFHSGSIAAHQAQCTVSLNKGKVHATYSAIPRDGESHTVGEKQLHPLEGFAEYADDRVIVQGKSGPYSFKGTVALGDNPHLLSFSSVKEGKEFVSIIEHPGKKNYLEGKVSYGMLREFFGPELQSLILGSQGTIYVLLHQGEFPNLKGVAYLKKGGLSLAGSYNLIEEGKASFEVLPDKRKALIKKMQIVCHRGTLTTQNASLQWTPRYELENVTAPLSLNNVLLNWEQDFYGLATGDFLFKKNPHDGSSIEGTLFLSKALINADVVLKQRKELNPIDAVGSPEKPMKVNLAIKSNEPITIKSSDFSAKSLLDLTARGSYNATIMQYPDFRGTITFTKGKCKFLRHNFKIKQGKIDYIPESHHPTTIEITAKAQIKKYNVTLQVTGPVDSPSFQLDSQPNLSQEQIVGLLLAGSEEATLQSDFAEIIMQNMNTLLFSSEDAEHKNSILRQLTKPLEFIQITPSTSDQNRAGLKGSFAIGLTPQLHAKVQKELTFDEDNFSYQLEYLVSDEVNLKLMRDPSGLVGGEAELRITF